MQEDSREKKHKGTLRKNRNTIYNALMVLLMIATVSAGGLFVGSLRGWFSQEKSILVTSKTGLAHMERKGVAYSLKEGAALQKGDRLKTLDGSGAVLETKDFGKVTLHEDTTLEVVSTKEDHITVSILSGEVFFNITGTEEHLLEVRMGEESILSSSGVYSVSVLSGSSSVSVYGGSVRHHRRNEPLLLKPGELLTILKEDPQNTYAVTPLKEEALNDFILHQLQKDYEGQTLFFTKEEAERILAGRQEALSQLLGESQKEQVVAVEEKNPDSESISDENGREEGETSENKNEKPAPNSGGAPSKEPTGQGSSSVPGSTEKEEGKPSGQGNRPVEKPPAVQPPSPEKPEPKVYQATLSIRVDSILNNLSELTPGKEQYVPQNGILLKATTVEFYQGETVFDVLKRGTKAAGIQLEYAYTPLYESYYVEGINHLYEFDVGSESGWLYQVNGWFPNYGSSSYKVKEGDVIVWAYTCKGLGADLGASVN